MTPIARSRRVLRSTLLQILSLALAAWCCAAQLPAQTPGFTSLDAPHAGTGQNQGTVPVAINARGVIAGYYIDSGNQTHSFVRTAAGVITEFDAAGLTGTAVKAINRSGQIVGNGFHTTRFGSNPYGFLCGWATASS